VGAAGRLSPEKGFGVLVEAAARLVGRDSTIGFIHFGDGPLRCSLQRRVATLGLAGRFRFAGHRSDLDPFMPFFDVLVLPSYTEGLPNVVLEALAASVPVIASAVGGTPEIVEDGLNGYLVPPGDPEVLARRVEQVLVSERERRAMGMNGKKRVLTEFTFETQARQYLRVFDDLLVPGKCPTVAAETLAIAR
jgi:glycosyltransferase involved in cell wall biosynthesis